MTERSKATKSNRAGEGPLLARIFGMTQEPRVILSGISVRAGVGGRRGRKRRRAEERDRVRNPWQWMQGQWVIYHPSAGGPWSEFQKVLDDARRQIEMAILGPTA